MIIGGLQKTSLIDYPNKISCVIFTQGCNFRCPFCHNPELVKINKKNKIKIEEVFTFLKKRKGLLDGVVICGGEPLLQDDLLDFMLTIKKMGYAIKLDTNGSFPKKLAEFISSSVVDYIAMDVKAPLEKYKIVTNSNVNTADIKKSIDIIINSDKEYEFRTTIVETQLSKEDILKIAELIRGAKLYVLQHFSSQKTLNKEFSKKTSFSVNNFNYLKVLLENSFVKKCIIR